MTFPEQLHFFLTLLIMSMALVFSLTQFSIHLSLCVMLSILLSILVCVADADRYTFSPRSCLVPDMAFGADTWTLTKQAQTKLAIMTTFD